MSIGDVVKARVAERRLFLLRPVDPRLPVRRPMLLGEAMQRAVIDGPWQDEEEEIRLGVVLRAELERFVLGEPLWITLNGAGRPKLEDFKRLRGATEVWEFKGKTPPQVRVFGRFAAKDVFVATHWIWRRDIPDDDPKEWKREFRRCRTTWTNLFRPYPPHTGVEVDDYVGDSYDTRLAER